MPFCPRTFTPLLLAASLSVLTGCANTQGAHNTADSIRPAGATATVIAVASGTPELSTFSRLVQQAGLQATLDATGPVTVFAPTDDAFKALPAATLDKLARDPSFLKDVLSHHVVAGLIKSADVDGARKLTDLSGGALNVSKAGDFITIDEGLVAKADVSAANGVIHVVDRVVMPPKK